MAANLKARIHDEAATIDEIGSFLDGLSHSDRMLQLSDTSRGDQRLLWGKAAAAADLNVQDFVPKDVAPKTEVIHHGRNTLPIPGQRFFQKRFALPEDSDDRVFGYNHSPSKGLIGPGYFVAISTEGNAAWTDLGAIVVDYHQVPDGPVPSAWPKVIPNSKGLQKFVYKGTRDFMRKVSAHVSIGAAFKGDKMLDHYFTLCREDG